MTALGSRREKTFAEALTEARRGRGYDLAEVAKRTTVSRQALVEMEAGTRLPSGGEMAKLMGTLPVLRHWRHRVADLRNESASPVVVNEETGQISAAGPGARPYLQVAPVPRLSFADRLQQERIWAHLTVGEVADLVSVTSSAVSAWEAGDACPITRHYDQLVQLFPALRQAPEPDHRTMDKPGPVPGSEREVSPVPSAPSAVSPPAADSPIPPAASGPKLELRSALRTMLFLKQLRTSDLGASFVGLLRGAEAEGITIPDLLELLDGAL